MSAVIKGSGVVWSTGGITFTAGIVSSTNASLPQSASFQRTSEKTEIKDNGGIIRTQVFHGFKKSISITVVPSHASTVSGARSSMDAHCLTPGTTITVVDDSGTLLDASYNLISSRQNRSVDGVATVDLELEQGDESNDLTTAVS
jgi:hypothetical protein